MDLRVSRSLELLASLLQTTAEFARKEEQFLRETRTRSNAVNRKRSDAANRTEARRAAEIAEVESICQTEEERARSLHGARRTRIHHAHNKCIRELMTRARRAKEKWLNNLQLRHFHAKRTLPLDLKAADAAHAEFTAKLGEQRAALVALQKRTERSFGGYLSFNALLRRTPEAKSASGDRNQLLADLQTQIATANELLAAFRQFLLPRIFRYAPPILLLVLAIVGGGVIAVRLGFDATAFKTAGAAVAAALGIVFAIHFAGKRQAGSAALALADALAKAAQIHDACAATAQAEHLAERQRIQGDYDHTCTEINEQWNRADEIEQEASTATRNKIESQAPRMSSRNETQLQAKLAQIGADRIARLKGIQKEADTQTREFTETYETETARLDAEEKAGWAVLEAEWQSRIAPLYEAVAAMNDAVRVPEWNAPFVETWQPTAEFAPATRFAQLDLNLAAKPDALPQQLALPGSPQIAIPLALSFPEQGSLLFETHDGGAVVTDPLNNLILRLLTSTPPGKITFTILDPVGLGQTFAGLMHLADHEESLINRRIWTQRDQIEERLAELNEHIEKVIQMYLRNEYATITEYNAQAGSVAEKYHFLVVADFPAGFSETAAKRLQSIAVSGPRCGVFTLIHWDQRQPQPDGFVPDDLRQNSVCLHRDAQGWKLSQNGPTLVFDSPPEPELAVALVHKIGKASIDSNRVEVPFLQIAPKPAEMWMNDTTNELRIPIGRTGATKLQYLAIGKGTRQHALFAGKTGSGKSTLFHVIITNLALACSPEQVEFYLIDFKKGVEFKCYATNRLPHARVVAIESDREFGLSVLQRVDEELKRRGDMFRKLGVQDIAGYKRAGGTEPMPRSLLIIDEFQEFFTEDDEIAQNASVLFDRIVRQGRAFGIHVLLGSQTLGGAYTLARATLGQMVIRVALQCNEADAYLIMDDNNSAPRLLSRPGEGIYNDAAGALEGNSPFQVVWLSDEERDRWLSHVSLLAVKHHDRHHGPIVFEGNAPADLRENRLLQEALASKPTGTPSAPRVWLGAPNSIKGPTEAVFQRQSGNHLLIVGQRDEAALTMLGVALISLAAQHPIGTARFILIHCANPGSADAIFLEQITTAIPHNITVAGNPEIPDVMNRIAGEMKDRGAHVPALFVLIHGLQKFKKLRHEDDFSFSSGDSDANPGALLNNLICEGSSLGLHLIATVDSYNNVSRFISRKALSEIEMRVVFQMSANDSASLIDSPKASGLGLHRALLHNEQQGSLETFRPYAMPDAEWLQQATEKLAKL